MFSTLDAVKVYAVFSSTKKEKSMKFHFSCRAVIRSKDHLWTEIAISQTPRTGNILVELSNFYTVLPNHDILYKFNCTK